MKWIDVQDLLPKDGELVLALVEGYFAMDNPLQQKRSFWIFQAKFYRTGGWVVPFYDEKSRLVKYWMEKPKDPIPNCPEKKDN